MTDEEEKWLAGVREAMVGLPDYEVGEIRAAEVRFLIAEIDRLRARPAQADEGWLAGIRHELSLRGIYELYPITRDGMDALLAHIDATDGVLHDMQSDAGAMLAYEQGAAEERARIAREMKEWSVSSSRQNSPEYEFVLGILERYVLEPSLDLLPPAAARAALDAERRKVGVLRAAMCECSRMTAFDSCDRRIRELADDALEATK